jgi:hypothetical protein
MSRLKKSVPPSVAPKDDLIESLLENESESSSAPKINETFTSSARRGPINRQLPPPPSSGSGPDDAEFDFEIGKGSRVDMEIQKSDETEGQSPTLSVVSRDERPSVPKFELLPEPEDSQNQAVALEDDRTQVARVSEQGQSALDQETDQNDFLEPEKPIQSVSIEAAQPEKRNEPKDRLQKLEDVLRRLSPGFERKQELPPGGPRGLPKVDLKPVIQTVQPPPVRPPGVVAKPKLPDSTPTPELKAAEFSSSQSERAPTLPVGTEDERTVAAAQTPPPASMGQQDEVRRPVWQDAKTEAISRMTPVDSPDADPEGEQFMPTEVRPNSPGVKFREESRQAQPGAAIFSSAEAALRQSENLRVAQKRISDLESELERVRRENESLRSAGETLRRRMDELQANAESAELNTQETKKIAEEERKVLRGQIASRDREISDLKGRIDDAENRLESNFRKIRVRERDLEHRIEIIKAESQSIAASKDRMILELKRQIDQMNSELSHAKTQVQESFAQYRERQETARRAVRALRIALTVLEGEEDLSNRKAE